MSVPLLATMVVEAVTRGAYGASERSGALAAAVNRQNKALMKGTAVPKIGVMANAFPVGLSAP
jgi:hypothetical protein